MKLMWFHLMPYTELPDDFREKHPSVWVDIHSSLFDPRRAHHMYNDFMDEFEYAAECGFDAVCVNEHHSNGYGLMPSPNLIASSLARRTTDTALVRARQFPGAVQSADPRGGRVRDDRRDLGRAADRRVPGRLADGHLLRLRPEPVDAARPLSRSARSRRQGAGPSPTPSRSTAASTSSATSTSGRARCSSRTRRSGYPAAVRSRPGAGAPDGLRLLLPVVLRLQGRPGDDGRVLGRDGPARQGPQPVPRRLPAIRRRRREPRGGLSTSTASRPSISTAAACISTRASPNPPGYIDRGDAAPRHPGPGAAGRRASPRYETKFTTLAREMDAIVDKGYVIIGSPDEVAEQLTKVAHEPQCRPSDAAVAVRQHEQGSGEVQHRSCSPRRSCRSSRMSSAEWEDRWWPQPMDRSRARRAAIVPSRPAMAAE